MLGSVLLAILFVIPIQLVTCNEKKWDHFMFAQAWPPGTCADAPRDHHICHVGPKVKTWTIHGLWPSLGETKGPTSCNNSWHFDFSKIANLTPQLNAYWPNLYNDTPADGFWEHEWDKHGTCCTDLDSTAGEHNYFSTGLMLNKKYNLSQILSASGVVPDETKLYGYDDFVNAVNKAIGFKPVIECTVRQQKNGDEYHLIDQIQICLNKDFSPRSCYDETVYPSENYSPKGNNSTLKFEKGEKSDLIGRRNSHYHEPQSNCPRKYKFYYPPIHQV